MKRSIPIALVVLAHTLCWQRAAAETPSSAPATAPDTAADTAAVPDLARAIADEVVRVNPDLEAIDARIKALRQKANQATAWLDPQLALEYSNMPIDAWIPSKHAMSGIQFKLQQTFTYPGKLALRQEVAEGQVRQEQQTLAEKKVQLAATIQQRYYQLALSRQLKKITAEHLKLIAQFTDVVRIKYEVGKAGQQDLLRMQVLEAKLKDELHDFDRADQALSATINAARHRPTETSIATPATLRSPKINHDEKSLMALATKHRPLLARYEQMARTRKAAGRRAAREGYPDFTAWLGYRVRIAAGQDPGTDFVTLGMAIPLPFSYDRRWGTEERQQQLLARSAMAQRKAALDRIRGQIATQLAHWRRAGQKSKDYRLKLMPLAHRALDATFGAYQVDRAGFASLYQAELQLLNFERAIRLAEANAAKSRVAIEGLVGTRVSDPKRSETK